MKVLVYGAGVIGSYLTHVLCAAGNQVTLLARRAWRETLERDGLTITHHLQKGPPMTVPGLSALWTAGAATWSLRSCSISRCSRS